MEGFSRELREYIVPEVVDAYLSADKEALRMWCGEAVSGLFLQFPDSDAQLSVRHTTSYGLPWSNT